LVKIRKQSDPNRIAERQQTDAALVEGRRSFRETLEIVVFRKMTKKCKKKEEHFFFFFQLRRFPEDGFLRINIF